MRYSALAGQEDLLLEQERPGCSSSHLGFTVAFPADVRPEHIVSGADAVVRGYAALRLRFFRRADGGYDQEVQDIGEHRLAIEFHDVSDADAATLTRYLEVLQHRDAQEWDWANRAVYRFVVVKAAGGIHHLVISLQQVAIDRMSIRLLLRGLVDAILQAADGTAPSPPFDDYESAVAEALPTPETAAAARRYWEREFAGAAEALAEHEQLPAAPPHSAHAVIESAAYSELTGSSAGPWHSPALFLERLLTEWARYHPGPSLVDLRLSYRTDRLARQIGMFGTVRPMIVDLGDPAWRRRVGGKLMRTAAHQHVDSCRLRALERRHAVPNRPFPTFNFVQRAEEPRSHHTATVQTRTFRPRRATARPVAVRIDDTGRSFEVTVQMNVARHTVADAHRMLHRLVHG
ncbi:condensation domain-containing protein [Nocardia sp. R6R-6]|uniref:condensation domain-containing protein n=1 Tax=Nocardia sp. R6R-6 TaxID=3459303 RepID=UPI00403E325C